MNFVLHLNLVHFDMLSIAKNELVYNPFAQHNLPEPAMRPAEVLASGIGG